MFRRGVLIWWGVDLGFSVPCVDVGASAEHERRLLERVREAAASLEAAKLEAARARELRDRAVRAALGAGVQGGVVAEAAGLTGGRVTWIKKAPRR